MKELPVVLIQVPLHVDRVLESGTHEVLDGWVDYIVSTVHKVLIEFCDIAEYLR